MPTNSVEYSKEYYQNHKEKMLENSRVYRKTNKKRRFSQYDGLAMRELRHLNKVKVLSAYSNPRGIPICNNCGEMDIDVLCIDHINGGGRKHVRSLRMTLYNWLIRTGYPEGFQVLCANCNMKKS